jgi:hypothetical protein
MGFALKPGSCDERQIRKAIEFLEPSVKSITSFAKVPIVQQLHDLDQRRPIGDSPRAVSDATVVWQRQTSSFVQLRIAEQVIPVRNSRNVSLPVIQC